MFDTTTLDVPISDETIRRTQPLAGHIRAHEADAANDEYDPVNSPRVMAPLLLKRVFDPDRFTDALFFDLFAGMAAQAERAISGSMRVYIDGMLSPRHENAVLFNQPSSCESFRDFVSRVADGRRFGIIVNGAEQWSDPLARMGARVFAPLVEALGNWRSMAEVTLFIGNYGYTPFGVHIDDPYTSVVHFHLGPTAKAMTLFSESAFHQLNGPRKNCFEPDRLTPHGQTYLIEAGDVFLLPPHWYHIGKTDGFSIGIALALSKYSHQKVSQQMLQHAIGEQRLQEPFKQLIARANETRETMAEWLERIGIEHNARAASRSWLRYSYTGRRESTFAPNTLVIRDPDFPMTTVEVANDLLVFARGNHIRLERSAASSALLKAIPHAPFTTRELFTALKGRIALDVLASIVGHLLRLGGLLALPAAVPQ